MAKLRQILNVKVSVVVPRKKTAFSFFDRYLICSNLLFTGIREGRLKCKAKQ